MKTTTWPRILAMLLLLPGTTAASGGVDLRDSLDPRNIQSVRVNLNPGGAGIGFEATFPGDDPRLVALLDVIRDGAPGGGHKCPNRGAIRIWLKDGSVIGIGLLPAHTPGVYDLRLYDGDRHLDTYRVERAALLGALAGLGVPTDDPAFPE